MTKEITSDLNMGVEEIKNNLSEKTGESIENILYAYEISEGIKKTNDAIEKMIENLKKAVTNKDILKTIEELSEFKKDLNNNSLKFKESKDDLIASPLRNLSEDIRKNSPIGKLEQFVTKQQEKAMEKLSNSTTQNKLLKAAWEVISSGCEVIKVAIMSVINNAIATGKFAQKIVDFGKEVVNCRQTGMSR